MKKSNILLFAIGISLVSACGEEEEPEQPTPDVIFPLREEDHSIPPEAPPAPEPPLVQHLIARQRQLFTVLASKQRAQLPDYLDPAFVWRAAPQIPRTAATYLTLLRGVVPDGLQPLPTNYHVFLQQGGFADVIASHESDAPSLVTSWRLTDEGWRATETRVVAPR